MFGAGGLGGFLPMLGMLGGGFSGGGLFSLGFTLLSGLLQNIGAPKNPGFENFATHPGFQSANSHPGFGTMGNGPSVSTVGNMNGYFGSQYSNSYSILPQTPAGQYYGNAGYSYGNNALTYSPYPQPPAQHHQFGNSQYRQQIGNLNFHGNLGGYQNAYNSFAPSYPPVSPSYHYGQTFGSYGSAPAPYSQGYQPVVSHYGFGSPQQYNPASTLYGHQNGSVQISYGQPQTHTTYGGPQGNQTVVHNHYHIHVHNGQQPTEETPPVDGDYGTQEPKPYEPAPQPKPGPKPDYKPPGAVDPKPDYETPKPTPKPDDAAPEVKPIDSPARIVASTASTAPAQTSWQRVPHINTAADYGRASKLVADRITNGDSSRYHMGGQNPDTNADGMRPERMAAWFVFQQNNDLRLDMKSGYFYETGSNGQKTNKFHMSAVSSIVNQAGSNSRLGYEMVGDYLENRGMYADDMARSRVFNTQPVQVNLPQSAAEQRQGAFGISSFNNKGFGNIPSFG